MLSGIAAELATPRLVARHGYRRVFSAGLLLLGLPALALTVTGSLQAIMVVCVLRGIGFGMIMVSAGALVASLVPAERRGEGLGLYGAGVVLPGVVALPLGVWLVGSAGFPAVFLVGGVAALTGLLALRGIPDRTPDVSADLDGPVGVLAGARNPALLRPAVVFAATTSAAGIVVAFLPLALGHAAAGVATVALLAQAAAAMATRWWAGRHADRHGASTLLLPGLMACVAGVLALVLAPNPAAVVGGMVLFGAGFGVTQSVSLTMMLERVAPSGYGTVNSMWSVAYDAGYGIGPAVFGLLAAHTGYPAAFGLTAALMLAALGPAHRDRTA
jgi:MFS family permease